MPATDSPPHSIPSPAPGGFRFRWPFLLLLPLILLAGALLWQSLHPVDPRETQAMHVYMACRYFAQTNEGRLPQDLQELVPKYLSEGGEETSRWIASQYDLLQPGASFEVVRLENRPLLREKPVANPGPESRLALAMGDGSVRWETSATPGVE